METICVDCIGDLVLKSRAEQGKLAKCDYCREEKISVPLGNLSELFINAITKNFDFLSEDEVHTEEDDDPDYSFIPFPDKDIQTWDETPLKLSYVLAFLAEIPESAAYDMVKLIRDDLESETDDNDPIVIPKRRSWRRNPYYAKWLELIYSIQHSTRFFNRNAEKVLQEIFSGINTKKTTDNQLAVVDAGPGTEYSSFFRARAFENKSKLEDALSRPDIYLASPPFKLATAGRLNARGVSVFYGAGSKDVAIAEVRPPVGSQVVVAKFQLIRKLRLLNLMAFRYLDEKRSFFDSEYDDIQYHVDFLKDFVRKISAPIMPEDEALDYIPTQAIADFLASRDEPRIDGILYPSIQLPSGFNVVLFNKFSRVERLKIEDNEGYFKVTGFSALNFPNTEYRLGKSPSPLFSLDKDDTRDDSLKVDLKSISIHKIRGC